MSETTPTSLVLTSVAARLKAAGFRQTGIARAVVELVWEYLGIHANMSPWLVRSLSETNTGALDLLKISSADMVPPLPPSTPSVNPANDPTFQKVA
jgi:hypothetical protein